jgi:hypothetical protein
VRRAAKALLFPAAVTLLGLVLYHRTVVAPGDLRSAPPPCRGGAAGRATTTLQWTC